MEQNEKVGFTLKLDPIAMENNRLERQNQALQDSVNVLVKLLNASQVKHGHWQKFAPAGIYECSVCGGDVMTNDIVCYTYCHHCGAKMDGGKNDKTD